MSAHILVIGKTGQLARALQKEITLGSQTADFIDRKGLDLTSDANIIRKTLNSFPPYDALILAAAYTAVDQAETDIESAMAANARAPSIIAEFCKERNIPLIHISTDYVFNGQASEPYQVTSKAAPLNTYGRSKRDGELAIQTSGCRHAILRTSWVYDGHSKNFLTTMLGLAETHKTVSVVNDQHGRPTYAGHLAQAVLRTVDKMVSGSKGCHGLFHVTNTGPIISWADFAQVIFTQLTIDTHVNPISTREYPTPAARPTYSALDTSKFETIFDYALPSWQVGLSAALAEQE